MKIERLYTTSPVNFGFRQFPGLSLAIRGHTLCFYLNMFIHIYTVETVYKHHPQWKANAMLIASYVYVQILFYYIIDKLFSKGVGGSSFGGFKKFL